MPEEPAPVETTSPLMAVPESVPSAARRAVAAIVQALCQPRLSQDALRRAVVRYGAVARDLALDPTEMLAALVPIVRRCAVRFAPSEQARLPSWVQWWAIHGSHRAE